MLPAEPSAAGHAFAVKHLKSVYQHVKTVSDPYYGDIAFGGMESLYDALGLRSTDVFYDLGSGVGRLTLYVALRCEVFRSVGLEAAERRCSLAEEARGRLQEELGGAPQSQVSLLHGDPAEHPLPDATVVDFCNFGLAQDVVARTLANVIRGNRVRRVACSTPLPVNCRIQLVRTLKVACTWVRSVTWHIYDVRPALPHNLSFSSNEQRIQVNSRRPRECRIQEALLRFRAQRGDRRLPQESEGAGFQRTNLLPASGDDVEDPRESTSQEKKKETPVNRRQTISALLAILGDFWGKAGSESPVTFLDLGCEDGRVVTEVCNAFPNCRGVGMDLNLDCIEWARARAQLCGISDRSEFHLGEASTEAKELIAVADAVFLHLSTPVNRCILEQMTDGCRSGALVLSSVGALPPGVGGFQRIRRVGGFSGTNSRSCLICYVRQQPLAEESEEQEQVVREEPHSEDEEHAQLPVLVDSGSTRRKKSESVRESILLPVGTRNLLCNWSPVGDSKISLLIDVLQELWNPAGAVGGDFCDLGCGDGRVVLDVCKAFPACRGLGVDLNAKIVAQAQMRSKAKGLEDRCEFRVADMSEVKLLDTTVVFLYLPLAALSYVLKRVLPKSGLRNGALLFSADGPFPAHSGGFQTLSNSRPRACPSRKAESQGLHCYTWTGAAASAGLPLAMESEGARAAEEAAIQLARSVSLPNLATGPHKLPNKARERAANQLHLRRAHKE
eukprot:gnl/TRDRNA2_/TRDRNA2_172668_c1_seq2.p1 gnl/TRDRNA2_/TRDRNA2_172668_c1~~gnl/TRDRNA2_/TRDRNA2_172668_c1_seq2.p1  ORF type:complete len:729 (-),score=98.32 gnl/TRDRNA2_/TRDRNA2_172668_c1_seq2:26-2212(-)